ncbi:MAG TPA: MFS transporter, partial [Mycobacteriales bacterium]|nr:MFS transporter [Mycobacteriales bacterium]
VGGSGPAFAAGAGCYAAGALLLLRVPSPVALARDAVVGWRSRLGELAAGARVLGADATLRLTTVCLVALFGFIGALFTLEPNFLADEVGAREGSLGAVYAAAGLGSCISAVLVARRPMSVRPVPRIGIALAAVGLCTAGYSTSTTLAQAIAWNFVIGLCFGQTLPPAFSLIQRRTPSAVIGRAMAFVSIVQQSALGLVALLVGEVLGGPVRARLVGVGTALVVVGAVVFVVTRLRDDAAAPAGSPDAGGSSAAAEALPPVELAPAP